MLIFNRNIITAKIEGINSFECEEKVKELIHSINGVVNIKLNRNKNKLKIKVKNSKKMDLSTIQKAIDNAGCNCTLIKNY